jgi:hypothetical protein
MDKIFKTLLSLMEGLVKVAPHLKEILNIILRKSNAISLSENQIDLLSPDLLQFETKISSLASILDYNKEITVYGPKYSAIKIHLALKEWMKIIEDFQDLIGKCHFKPLVNQIFQGNNSSAFGETSQIMRKIIPHFVISYDLKVNPISLYKLSPLKEQSIFLLKDSLLALSKLNPKRKIAVSGSLHLRDLKSPLMITLPSYLQKHFEINYSHYSVTMKNNDLSLFSDSKMILQIETRKNFFDDEISLNLFKKPANELDISDLYKSYEYEGIYDDENFGKVAIWNRIVGSSLSSLDYALEILCLVGMKIYEEYGEYKDFRKIFESRGLPDLMYLCSVNMMNNHFEKIGKERLSSIHVKVMEMIKVIIIGLEEFDLFDDIINYMTSA